MFGTIRRVCIGAGAVVALTLATVGTRAQAPQHRRLPPHRSRHKAVSRFVLLSPDGRVARPAFSGRTPTRSPARADQRDHRHRRLLS